MCLLNSLVEKVTCQSDGTVPHITNLDEGKISMIRVQSPKCFRVIQMVGRINGYMSPAVKNFKEFVEKRAIGMTKE